MAGVKGRSGRPRKYPARIETPGDLSPLAFLLHVMQRSDVDPKLRLRAAIATAPYVHERRTFDARPGKKALQRVSAQKASLGKFGPPTAPPKLVVDNPKPPAATR